MKKILFFWIMAFVLGSPEANADCATHMYDCGSSTDSYETMQSNQRLRQMDEDEGRSKADCATHMYDCGSSTDSYETMQSNQRLRQMDEDEGRSKTGEYP